MFAKGTEWKLTKFCEAVTYYSCQHLSYFFTAGNKLFLTGKNTDSTELSFIKTLRVRVNN